MVRKHENSYEVDDLVLWRLYDMSAVCKVVYKGPNYLEIVDIRNPAPEVFPHRVYEIGIDRDLRKIK